MPWGNYLGAEKLAFLITLLFVQRGLIGKGTGILLAENPQLKKLSVSCLALLFLRKTIQKLRVHGGRAQFCLSRGKKDGDVALGSTSSGARSELENVLHRFSPRIGSTENVHVCNNFLIIECLKSSWKLHYL